MCVYVHVTVDIWRTEDNFQEPVLSSHYMGPDDETQVVKVGG